MEDEKLEEGLQDEISSFNENISLEDDFPENSPENQNEDNENLEEKSEDSADESSPASFFAKKLPSVTKINKKITIGLVTAFAVVACTSFCLSMSAPEEPEQAAAPEEVQEMNIGKEFDGNYNDLAKYNKPKEKTIDEEIDEDLENIPEEPQKPVYTDEYIQPASYAPVPDLQPAYTAPPTEVYVQEEKRDRNSPIAFFNFKQNNGSVSSLSQSNDEQSNFKFNAAKDKNFYNTASLQRKLSPYEIKAGSIVPATLITGINSDLPGTMIAQVRLNVRDSRTGKYILIPQGTKLIGVYNSKLTTGQGRVQVAWQRMIFPNGDSYDLDGAGGADGKGMSGLTGKTNNHHAKLAQGAFWTSVFAVTMGSLIDKVEKNNSSGNDMLANNLSNIASNITNQSIKQQPTIVIKPGVRFNVMVEKDMILRPYTGRG